MTDKNKILENPGIEIPETLIPNDDIDISKWAVIACDQYTSEPEYWDDVENITKDSPSTYKLILPEIFLDAEDINKRYDNINLNMKNYLGTDKFKKFNGLIYVERELNDKSIRSGLVLALDLEKYDFSKGSKSLIRATEGTIVDRLPPRVKIREKAVLEIPHILVFIDDPDMKVIESLSGKTDKMKKLYDFDLMKGGNHIKGYGIEDENLQKDIFKDFSSLIDDNYKDKYKLDSNDNKMLFAMGDGNHSLATAKVHWENIKKENGLTANDTHPARYALVEVVNIHNKGIIFKSIDRVIFNIDSENFLEKTETFFRNNYDVETLSFNSLMDLKEFIKKSTGDSQHIGFVTQRGFGAFKLKNTPSLLAHATITDYLDLVCKEVKLDIDYIHGEDTVTRLGSKKNNIGFILPAIDKNIFFESVLKDGSLPKKTFSMGDANEKRYYLECRKIT